MENNENNSNPLHNELIDGEKKQHTKPLHNELIEGENPSVDGHRHEENIDKNTSSNVSSLFNKKPSRTNRSFGAGHEPGTLPGGGV